ncbi:expressed unknown protein [Seminavis robusta]|uniref:Uncharacterized protein n=1 Tax=Seminavis robusta TaxID=568900 RepID=A0A9N8DCT8_9STRA|nr:expressed unknown protein [Seminavis robusta]|eukprot:Sro88_g046330.1 n/a (99) ;mRNA; f:16992-17288
MFKRVPQSVAARMQRQSKRSYAALNSQAIAMLSSSGASIPESALPSDRRGPSGGSYCGSSLVWSETIQSLHSASSSGAPNLLPNMKLSGCEEEDDDGG